LKGAVHRRRANITAQFGSRPAGGEPAAIEGAGHIRLVRDPVRANLIGGFATALADEIRRLKLLIARVEIPVTREDR
jgi:hypothetical protein